MNLLSAYRISIILGLLFCPFAAIAEPVVYVLKTEILQQLESGGYSLNETLGGKKSISRTADLFKTNSAYREFTEVISKTLSHDKKTDQLPDEIPEGAGDVPNMVKRLRGFEDKGARSDKDLKGGFFIRK